MSLYVKICGLTHSEHISAAVEAGADAIGFVFAPSPRLVTLDQALNLADPVREKIQVVAVTLHPTAELVEQITTQFKPQFLQTDYQDFAEIDLPPSIESLPVFRDTESIAESVLTNGPILFESAVSGAGELADWSVAAKLASRKKIILAGGLDPDNVASAIRSVNPWGVDVSSGVEKSRGIKDPEKIFKFVQRARSVS